MGQIMEQKTEVLVVGASLEGCITALELAKAGYQVVLTEESGSLGGMATNGLEVYLPWETLTEPRAGEYAKYLWTEAGQREDLLGPIYHDQKCKLILRRMLQDAGVTVLTHVFPAGICRNGEELICDMAVKTGRLRFHAAAVIDATDFGEMAGIAGWTCKLYKKQVSVSVKWNGIPEEQVKNFLLDGYEETKGCIVGTLQMDYTQERDGIKYCAGQIGCRYNSRFGETIMTGLTAVLPEVDSFTLSRAQAGLRMFVYSFRDYLRKEVPGFEKANIIHVSPILNRYEMRRFEKDSEKGLFLINGKGLAFSSPAAIGNGIMTAEKVNGYLAAR